MKITRFHWFEVVLIFLGLLIVVFPWLRDFMIFDVVPFITFDHPWILLIMIIIAAIYSYKRGFWYEKIEREQTLQDTMNEAYKRINDNIDEQIEEVKKQHAEYIKDIEARYSDPLRAEQPRNFHQEEPQQYQRPEPIRVYPNEPQEHQYKKHNYSGVGSPIRKLLTWVSMQPDSRDPIKKERKKKKRPFNPNAGTYNPAKMSEAFMKAARYAAYKAGLNLKKIDKEDI